MHNCKTINIGMGCCHKVLAPVWEYYTKEEIDELIEGIIAGDIDLSGYVTDERLAEILSEYAQNGDLEALRQRLDEEVDKLSTEVEKRAQKEDIEALEERVEDIESKIDDVDGVTEEKVNEMIKDKADKSEIPSLDGYATEQWVTDKNYLTEHQHLKTVNGNSLIGDGNIIIDGGGESVDLSDYYTKEESDGRYGQKSVVDGLQSQIDDIDGQLSTKAEESALEALKQEIEELSKSGGEINEELGRLDSELDTVRDRVDSKADRSDLANYQPKGDYATKDELNDYQPKGEYATKDEIPNLNGYATEQWVNEKKYLTEHQHLKTINGETLVGDGNIEIETESVDLSGYYTKEESDGRYGSKEEQESLRNDVEEALGESAKNEADLQKKADKSELDNYQPKGEYALKSEIPNLDEYALKTDVPTIWQGTAEEYERIVNKDSKTIYLIYDN